MSEATYNERYAIQAVNMSKRFGAFTAVDSLNITVERGEIFGFLGANGAGKTTAIRVFCGLLTPSSGDAWVAGKSVKTEMKALRTRIGYMSQKFSLYEDLTVAQNLELYGGIYKIPSSVAKERSQELLGKVGLLGMEKRETRDIPLGFKQRLALGCALLHRPEVVFLDEPTSGVDPVARRKFWDLIYEVADEGTTVFVTTHYMDEAEYCGRVSLLVAGKLAALDTPTGMKQSVGAKSMQEAFLSIVQQAEQELQR
ncbi:MAG: ATP-binding cassette domain-containing protein [bacterium]|nr:ATP-binding cassette domain-containing protein [bacterium]